MIYGSYLKSESRFTYLENLVKDVFIKHFLPKEEINESFRLSGFEQIQTWKGEKIYFEWTNPFSRNMSVSLKDFIKVAKPYYYKSIKNNSGLNIDVIRYMLSESKEDFLLNEFDRYNEIISIRVNNENIRIFVRNNDVKHNHQYQFKMNEYLQFERDFKIDKILT